MATSMNIETESPRSIKHYALVVSALLLSVAAVVALSYIVLPTLTSVSYSVVSVRGAGAEFSASTTVIESATKPSALHEPTPAAVKSIYMSQCVVGTPSRRDELVKLIDNSELNTVVIDVRDSREEFLFLLTSRWSCMLQSRVRAARPT